TRALRPKESFDAVARSGGESARDAVALFASPVSSLRDSLGASGEWESRASSSSTSGDSFASRDNSHFLSSSSIPGDLTASRVRTLTTDSHLNTHLDWQKDNPSNSTNANNQQPREARNQTNPSTNTRQGATSQLTANSQFTGSLKDALYTYFGHRQFREHQEQICHEIIEGSDLLLVMPTGAGKSLCYQLPAIVLDGCTIVISPLIALMDDQVQKLKSLGIAAGALHSGLSREQSRALCVDYQEGRLKLLYIAPERLGLSGFADFLARTPPSLIAIDEAHCISQWGHDFRPDYRMLAQRLLKLRPAPIVAMTATATPLVQKDIAIQLDLRNPSLHIHGFRRTNIAIEISEVSLPDRPQLTEQLLSNPGSRPAIVYAPTRKDTESVSQKLSGRVAAYHAGLSHEIRQQVQRDFQAGKLDVIVATVAFGMGIDKSDIRTVVHIALPSSVEAYYQEIGRAGRDGKPSRAILLHSYADHRTREFFVKKNYPDVKVLEKVMAKIPAGGILRSGIRSELDAQALDNALEKLWVHGAIDIDTNDEVKPVSKTWQRSYLNQQIHKEAEVGLMSNFAQNQQHCRMMLFLNHFGDLSDNRNGCGICDFCAPVTSLSKIFRAPNVIEQRAMFGILEILKIAHRPQSITKVFQALESNRLVTDRKVFDVLVDCLTRSGAVNSSQDSFEKDGQTISYRTLALAGQDMPTLDLDALLIVEPSQSEEKVRYRRGKGTKSKTATKTKVKKEKKVYKAEALNDPLSQKLRGWRLQMAKKERVPAYRIFSDKTLADIAHSRPRSLLMLSEIDGIGAVKLAKYGNDLINMLGGH
ncbi:MAG: ATP-dependent DNA helicase RecQ, partial [Proteobacteria bacterium]